MPAALYFGTVFLFRPTRISYRPKFVVLRIRGFTALPPKCGSRQATSGKSNDKISRADILASAYAQCRSNKGAPGVDGQDLPKRFTIIDTVNVGMTAGNCQN